MTPAKEPRSSRESARLLVINSAQRAFRDARITDLPELLQSGDLLVLNDAATIPASLRASTADGGSIEIRLLRHARESDWVAVLLGEGDWRTPTELRDPPERVGIGDRLQIAGDFVAEVVGISDVSDRLVTLRFNRSLQGMWAGIYAYGRPVQYSYLKQDIALWSVQTAYASRPWAMEMPSAGSPLTWSILLQLKRRGVELASQTHAAGLSATGHEELDDRFPMPESFEIPTRTADAIDNARRNDRRVIAVGTTVVRALEGCASWFDGRVVAGRGETDLIIDRSFRPAVVSGVLTGIHDPTQSHFRLLHAFADETTLRRAWRHALEADYLCHEFGDSCLILWGVGEPASSEEAAKRRPNGKVGPTLKAGRW
jgi:S-adenosylmethionine:tRNA ribosyltransferase-isomerase